MSTLTIKVCEECGKQAVSTDAWLVMKSLDVRSAKTKDAIVISDSEIDLCGPGCLLRYISRVMEPVMGARSENARVIHSCAHDHQSVTDAIKTSEFAPKELAQAI